MMSREKFVALKREDMYQFLLTIDASAVKGKSRARKEELITIYDARSTLQAHTVNEFIKDSGAVVVEVTPDDDVKVRVVEQDPPVGTPDVAVMEDRSIAVPIDHKIVMGIDMGIDDSGVQTGRVSLKGEKVVHVVHDEVQHLTDENPRIVHSTELFPERMDQQMVRTMASPIVTQSSSTTWPIKVNTSGPNDHKVATLDAKLLQEASLVLGRKPANRRERRALEARRRQLVRDLQRQGISLQAVHAYLVRTVEQQQTQQQEQAAS